MTNDTTPVTSGPVRASSLDLDASRASLQTWLRQQMPEARDLSLAPLALTGGLSHEILKLAVTWRQDGRDRSQAMVVRIDPVNFRKRRQSNLRREFEALKVLGDLGTVPVPGTYWYETDTSWLGAEFYAMAHVDGRVAVDNPPYQLEGWVADLGRTEQRTLWREAITTMATLHRVPVAPFAVLRRNPDGTEDDFSQNLAHWYDSYQWAMEASANQVTDDVWDWLRANVPANRPPGITWGDARWANLMFEGLRCVAMLDWEDVAVSTPLHDLGRWLWSDRYHESVGYPSPDGFGDRTETIGLWEQVSGLSAADIRWYEAFTVACGIGVVARQERLSAGSSATSTIASQMTVSRFIPLLEAIMTE